MLGEYSDCWYTLQTFYRSFRWWNRGEEGGNDNDQRHPRKDCFYQQSTLAVTGDAKDELNKFQIKSDSNSVYFEMRTQTFSFNCLRSKGQFSPVHLGRNLSWKSLLRHESLSLSICQGIWSFVCFWDLFHPSLYSWTPVCSKMSGISDVFRQRPGAWNLPELVGWAVSKRERSHRTENILTVCHWDTYLPTWGTFCWLLDPQNCKQTPPHLFYLTLLYPASPYSTLLYPTLPYSILLYPTSPYSTLPHPTLPYISPFSTLLCPTLTSVLSAWGTRVIGNKPSEQDLLLGTI